MHKKKKRYQRLIKNLGFLPIASAAITTQAQNAQGVAKGDITEIILKIINYALIVIGVLAVAVFIYAGFLYLTAAGDETKLKNAKTTVLYAVVGLAVAVLGYVAVLSVQRFIVAG